MSGVLVSIQLTGVLVEGVEHGLAIDRDNLANDDGGAVWGAVRYEGKTVWLDVYDFDLAVWRVTSSRDIYLDNAESTGGTERADYRSQARRLQVLVDKLVAAAGADRLSAETKGWL